MSISEKVRELIPEAIAVVSQGNMRFTVRQLFYKVRELYLKRYPNEPFFGDKAKRAEQGYDTFTQDFIPSYERKYGKINGMIREKRGNYCSRREYNIENVEVDDTLILDGFDKGVSDKILVVEKAGFYRMLIENSFPQRFDLNIICLQGFSTEAGRNILKVLEDSGFKILVLHDYDINGILICETLTKPTKRRDIFVENIIDLGFDWNDVQEFINRGLLPEPTKLSKQDTSKLEGLLQRGNISEEEYEFLKHYRIELNALTPLDFLEWLKQKFEQFGIWKVVPSERELASKVSNAAKIEIEDEIKKQFGIEELNDIYYELGEVLSEFVWREDDLFKIKVDLEEFKEFLKQDELSFWRLVAHKYTVNKLNGKREKIIQELIKRGLREELKDRVKRLEEIVAKIKAIVEV
ncbi:hypothetical protein DRO97_11090 [Archaeoglobales archaeon]|nr:MAG: hypothetical protein DRO97_11090 [Archaeoglobales archaeon]